MSGIAQLFLSRGIGVSGSDLKKSNITDELEKMGARISIGHDTKNIDGAELVVYSSAIKEDNPEIKEARNKNIPVIKRAQALAELMKDKTVITVTGSHGKTTVTSLVSFLLIEAGLFPTVAIGGILKNINKNAYAGGGNLFVAEADESDGSFLYYEPRYSIITNIDYEHLDYYANFENEIEAFRKFMDRTHKEGCIFACSDDMNIMNLVKGLKKRCVLFGLNNAADICAKNISIEQLKSQFDCFCKGKFVGKFKLSLGGMHNVSNSLSAIALGLELGIDLKFIRQALSNYKGAGRRIEVKLDNGKFTVIDDYAHHPTEIKATLAAVRNLNAKRVITVFQPHRYTRTKLLWDEFGQSFNDSDYIIITDIYPASEPPLAGVNAELLTDKIRVRFGTKPVYFISKNDIVENILKIIQPGDLIITLGAGDITKVNDELVKRIAGKI